MTAPRAAVPPSGPPPPVGRGDRDRILRLAEAATPGGRVLGPPGESLVTEVVALLYGIGPAALTGYRGVLRALDLAAWPLAGARLSALPLEARVQALARLSETEGTAALVRLAVTPVKMVRAEDEALLRHLGVRRPASLPLAEEPARWRARRVDARTLGPSEEVHADVVVVGTGAGGAPVAARLAARGHAVVLLEEGGYFGRRDFDGRPLAMHRLLYRDHGLTLAFGNTVMPVPVGRTVGGSTTINSGTCYRTPDDVLRRWQFERGLWELGPGALDPHFESVERALGVEPTPPSVLGGVARVIARGAEALGYRHGPLARNAPGCDAQALCCFGCPTDAKRSTNVSYVPMALEQGAMLFHHTRVERVLTEGRRAVGVEATSLGADGTARRLSVRARAVVLACGTFHTPVLRMQSGLCGGSGQLGRNLTVHPCGYAWARFDEEIRGFAEVPQGYAVEEFVDQGIRFEGGFAPLALAAGSFASLGDEWTARVEGLDRLACFGFMVRETSRGRVTVGAGGRPSIRYAVNDADVRTLTRAQALLARIYFAAGAREVVPGVQGWPALRGRADVERLEREGPDRLRARHHDLTAYHPLGTCAMGADPRRAVVSSEHETHEVEALFVCDGSAVPGPLGVNPQITIMALSERAASFVERRLGSRRAAPRVPAPARALVFHETMAGVCARAADGARFRVAFTVEASSESDAGAVVRARGAVLALRGTLTAMGVAEAAPCLGTLCVRPVRRRSNVVYDLSFTGDDGAAYTLHGEKHAPYLAPTGMTRLHTELRRDGEPFATGTLHFDLADLAPFLAGFRLRARGPARDGAADSEAGAADGAADGGTVWDLAVRRGRPTAAP